MWQRFRSGDPKEESKPVSLPQYFAPDTNLMRAHTLLYSNSLQKKYPHDILMILALLPPEYGTFLNAFKEDLSAPPHSELLFHIAKSEVCRCEPVFQGESIVHEDHLHFRAFLHKDVILKSFQEIFDRLRPGILAMTTYGSRRPMRRGALSADYRQNAYYDIRGILEEEPRTKSHQSLTIVPFQVSRQVLEPPRTRRRLEEIRGHAANNGDHAPMIASFLKECDYQYTVGASLAGAVLSLIEQGKFTEKDRSYNEDVTVEDAVSLLPGRKPTSRVIFTTLRAQTGIREDAAIVPSSLLHNWDSTNYDHNIRDEAGWYFRPSGRPRTPDPKGGYKAWETPIPKTVLIYLPHSKTASEVLAVCTVMTAMCDVFLYGVGTKKTKIQKAVDESQHLLYGLFTQVFSKDAGNYAWWDTGDEGGFSFRFHSFIEDPTSYEACHSGVLVLDIASRALHGSLGDLFRYGRLGRLGNQSGYVPHGTNTTDIDSVRKQSAAVLSRHLEYPLTLIRSVKSSGRTNNMERLELGEYNDGSEAEAATADLNAEFEAAEAEAEVEAGGQAEDEAEFAELQAEAMLAVGAELKELES